MKNLVMTFVMLTMIGCESLQEMNGVPTNTSSTVVDSVREQKEQTEEITDASGTIQDKLDSIDNQADSILNDIAMVPEDKNYNIDPTLDSIENSAEAIKEHVDDAEKEQVRIEEALEDLEGANARVSAAVGQISDLENLVEEYEHSDREVRKEALANLHSFITLFFVIGFGMLIGGAFLTLWVSGKLGGAILAIGVLTVGFASASQYYLEEIATIGLIVLIVGFFATLGVVGWMLLDGKNDKKAVKEIVQLVEGMKDRLSVEERKEIFGPTGIASKLTHNNTKKIISQIKIKNGWHK
jgi:lipopolysaccharide export LptBFGC system permease protein LptF